MMIAAIGVTKPEAGVIATSPATQPIDAPRTLGLPLCNQEMVSHVSAAIAAAVLVTTKALTARGPALSAEPELKPNQPNQSSAAPRTVIVASCGSIGSSSSPTRLPMIIAATRADMPELMWTTVPPAKSSAPSVCSQPPAPQTQWAIGS